MPKSILVVDDSASIRKTLEFTLAKAGFSVDVAEDGQAGLDKANNYEYDLIISDINMPRVNGYEFIKELRQSEQYKAKPILVLTTECGNEKKKEGREVGATGWIVKPFVPENLLDIVNKVFVKFS